MFISTLNIQKYIAGGVLLAVLFSGLVFFTPKAEAQSNREAMLAQISQLLQIVLALQAQLAAMDDTGTPSTVEGGFNDKDIGIGDRVKTTDILRVRAAASASANWINNVAAFTQGKVVNGPRYADGYTWWHVTYDSGTSGWSAENWLKKVSSGGVSDVPAVKCTIESSKQVVELGDTFEIDWYTDLSNPTMVDEEGERLVSNSGTRRYTGEYIGTNRYAIGSSKHGIACSVDITVVDGDADGDPSITLKYPKDNVFFDKSESNDDIVITWEAEDVPDNTNVIIEIESVQLYAGSVIGGGGHQVRAKEGFSEYRIAIDTIGTTDPGEYKVRLTLEECHSNGCSVNPDFPGNEEDLETYDRSSYGYFTVIDSDEASVRLEIPGTGDVDEIEAEPGGTVTVNYYPIGDIDECKVTADYDSGEFTETHPWPNTILAGQYGRSTFGVTTPEGVLEELRAECTDEDGRTVASDSITVDVDESEVADYEIIVDGEVEEDGSDVSKAEAWSRCSAAYNKYNGLRTQCSWNGDGFFDDTNWKG